MKTCKVFSGDRVIFDKEIATDATNLIGVLRVTLPTSDEVIDFGPACAWMITVSGADLIERGRL